MPEHFILEVPTEEGSWIDYGRYAAENFSRMEDGSYVCAGHGGSPIYLRCLARRGDEIDVVDGSGDAFTYRLIPLPDDRYGSYECA